MVFSEFNQIEVFHIYKSGQRDRNNIININEISSYYGYEEIHVSSGRFKDLKQYVVENNGSVSGFIYTDSKVYYDNIVIDIDNAEIEKIINFLDNLKQVYEINLFNIGLFFSGNKGFHILIPSKLFGLQPASNLNIVVKNIAKYLASDIIDIDTQIYNKTSTLRLVNTKHSKSGLYKIPLYYSELHTLSIDQIRELAHNPRKENSFMLPIENTTQKLLDIGKTLITTSKTKKSGYVNIKSNPKNTKVKLCILKMLEGIEKTNEDLGRKNVCFRLAVHLKNEGFPSEVTYGALQGWNNLNKPMLSDSVITSVLHSVYKNNYKHTCQDDVYKKYCNPNCYLFN